AKNVAEHHMSDFSAMMRMNMEDTVASTMVSVHSEIGFTFDAKAAVNERQTTLAAPGAQVSDPIDRAKLAEWNRTIDPSLFAFSCEARAAPGELQAALAEWFQAASAAADNVKLIGDVQLKRFDLHRPCGSARLARASALRAGLK
ncbi:unnamed protein product, partial [Prorocentrum cordatum]